MSNNHFSVQDRSQAEKAHSFSGSDVLAFAQIGDEDVFRLGNMSTFSYSIYREKEPVRRLGRVRAQGYTSGPRTVAGTLVMVTYEESAMSALLAHAIVPDREAGQIHNKADEIPPFTLYMVAKNEFGDVSSLSLLNTEIVSEGFVTGVDEVYIETTFQYVATDIVVLSSTTKGMGVKYWDEWDAWLEANARPATTDTLRTLHTEYATNPIELQ